LLIASPLFPQIVVHRGSGQTISIRALNAAIDTFYVQNLAVNGRPSTRAWLPESFLTGSGTLDYLLSKTPTPGWGAAPADAPPSFGPR
jgi:putative alpha-1,2-mannosidase